MNESEFYLLTSRVLAGEASPEEQQQLDRLLTDAGRRREFDELRATCATLRDASELVEAVHSDPEPIPAQSLNRLLDEIRSRRRSEQEPLRLPILAQIRFLLGQRGAVGVMAAIGSGLILWLLVFARSSAPLPPVAPVAYVITIRGDCSLQRGNAAVAASPVQSVFEGDGIRLETGGKAWVIDSAGLREVEGPATVALADIKSVQETSSAQAIPPASLPPPRQLALFTPRPVLLTIDLLSTTRSADGISVYSPRGATARLAPVILWRAEPAATYELILSDELDPDTTPWQVAGVRPPIVFEGIDAWRHRPLAPDHVYRLSIRRIDEPLSATEITFSTVDPALPVVGDSPAERLVAACDALTSSPQRVGDALADLLALPAPFAHSELALRLKLLAYGSLGLAAEFQAVHSELERLE
jgi:hypothetical protein